MANINLSQPSAAQRNARESFFDRSLTVSLGLLVLSFGTLFGLGVYDSFLNRQTAALVADSGDKLARLKTDSIDRLLDFQRRSDLIDEKLKVDQSQQDMFSSIEKLMTQGVYLSSYAYDAESKTISLKLVSTDFRNIAQQVMNFKSGSFRSVSVGNSGRGSAGEVTSEVVISL